MKIIKALILSIGLLFTANAVAQETPSDIDQEIRFLVGGKGLATDFGLEYEKRDGVIGKTIYLQHGKKRDAENAFLAQPEQVVLGFGYAVHLRDSSDFDIYLAPSIALIYQKEVQTVPATATTEAEEKDVFTAGPALKIGSLYTLHTHWTLGAEFVMMNNWFSDRIPASQTFGNFVLGYKF